MTAGKYWGGGTKIKPTNIHVVVPSAAQNVPHYGVFTVWNQLRLTNQLSAVSNLDQMRTYLKFHFTALGGAEWSFDLQHRLSLSIHDREPRVDEATVLLNVADGVTWTGY